MISLPSFRGFGASLITALVLTLTLTSKAGSLLGYYPFEGDYDDSSGSGNNAAPGQNPGEISFVSGFRGQGADINDPAASGGGNTGGTIDIPINIDPGALPSVSFGGWVNVETNNGFPGFMATDNGGWDRGISLNNNQWSIESGGNVNSGIVPVLGEWEYVVGTFDGATATLYHGTADAGSLTTSTTTHADNQTTPGLGFIEIGRYDNQDFDGQVDDIFVFDCALSAAKVNAIRNLRLHPIDYSPADAAALFDLFETGTSGAITGVDWAPAAGLAGDPGAVISVGVDQLQVILDDAGNGMAGTIGIPLDADNDTLLDTWEQARAGNLTDLDGTAWDGNGATPGPGAGTGDFDGDGRSDSQEFDDGTDPTDDDSDDDGSSDGDEATLGTDPRDSDSDGDGLLDGAETGTGVFVDANNTGTDPLDPDSDDDLIPDGIEVAGGFDPTDPNSRPEIDLASHNPERILYRRTDNQTAGDFTGALPDNTDQAAPFGTLDDPNSSLISALDVDLEPGNGGIDLTGDNHDLAFIFQFYDADGTFSFTENYDDRVKIVATPIGGSGNLTATGASAQHTDVSWNVRTFANFNFGGGGWFNVDIWLTEDGGGAQSAADIGFGYFNGSSFNTADFGGIGYAGAFGISSGAPAAFDTDGNGHSWGVYLDSFDPNIDSDGDSIPDGYEEQYFPGDLSQLGPGDFDDDGLTDLEEYNAGTNPTEADSDDDGISDPDEIANGTDPGNPDSDNDGLTDGEEVNTHMTDPNNENSDGDNFSDGAEVNAVPPTDPNDPNDPPPPPKNLLAYFPFEGDYNDASGNGNDAAPGQNVAEVSITADGFRGQGADINDPDANGGGNTGGTIDIPINANPDELPEVSFGGWVNLETNNGFPGFMAIDNGGWDRGMHLNTNSWGIASGDNTPGVAPATVGEWQYVVGTFDKPNGQAVLYVGDDDPFNQTTITGMRPDAGINPGEVMIEIGRYDNQDLDAVVDDMFVFAGALSDHQVNAIRNLALSSVNLSPLGAAELFALFEAGSSGTAGGLSWLQASGLDATNPGAVADGGGSVTVVLDDLGNGMRSGAPFRFEVRRAANGGLDLVWESKNGKLYRVRSETDPASASSGDWPIFDGHTDIAATPDENTLNIPLPAELSRFFVIEEYNPPPVTVLSDDFENGQGGWTTGVDDATGNTIWGFGLPAVTGPVAASSGVNCFGTNIDDNYEINANIWLRSPSIELPPGAESATLRYSEFRDIEAAFDAGQLAVLDAADDSVLAVLQADIDGDNGWDWAQVTRRLPAAVLDRDIKIEFRFQSDDIQNFAGWYIDDVELTVP